MGNELCSLQGEQRTDARNFFADVADVLKNPLAKERGQLGGLKAQENKRRMQRKNVIRKDGNDGLRQKKWSTPR